MSHPAPPADQLVTSSDLVRHFGLWQERAARAPLYILHRGRPRFVLTSVETMETLCAPHARAGSTGSSGELSTIANPVDATALLDGVSDLVLLVDANGAIIASSRAARAHFGATVALAAPVDAIAPPALRAMLPDAIRQVIAAGIGTRLEIPSARREGRTLSLSIEPSGNGVALFARDGTTERDLARAMAAEHALGIAVCAAAGVVTVAVDRDGCIVEPSAEFADLTGLARDSLATRALVTLTDGAKPASFIEAITATMTGLKDQALRTMLLVHHAQPRAVRIGFAQLAPPNEGKGAIAILVVA